MLAPQPTWHEPIHQGALRALVRAGGSPYLFSPHESHWIIDSTRSAVIIDLPEGFRVEVLESQLRKLLTQFPKGGVDLVILGSDETVRATIQKALPRYSTSSIGIVHVSARGELWEHRASSAIAGAMREAFKQGIPESVPIELLVEELNAAAQAGHARIEALRSFSRSIQTGTPWGTYALSAVLVAIFGLEWILGRASGLTLLHMGSCVADRVKHGELWRLLSSALLHVNLVHLFFNTISLISLGTFYERLLGTGRMLVLFVLAAIGGSLAVVFFAPLHPMVGASGGIFGMLGAAGALALRPGTLLPRDYVPAFRRNIVMNLVLQLGFAMQPNISVAAHVGGGIVGFLLMISGLLVPGVDNAGRRRSTWLVPATFASAMLLGSFAVAMARGTPWKSSAHAWTRQSLPGIALTAELPGPVRAVPRQDAVREFEVGDVEQDGFVASLVISPSDVPDTVEGHADAVDAVRRHGLGHPADTQLAGDPIVLEIGGFPVVAQDARAENSVQFRNWLQIRHATIVSVQMYSRNDAPPAIQDVPRRILASVRGD